MSSIKLYSLGVHKNKWTDFGQPRPTSSETERGTKFYMMIWNGVFWILLFDYILFQIVGKYYVSF